MAMSRGLSNTALKENPSGRKELEDGGGEAQGLGAVTDPGELRFVVKWLAVMDV